MTSRILFVHNLATQFVRIDLKLLREKYEVREWEQRGQAVDVPSLAQAVGQSDLVFGWFASWHTLWPVLLARTFNRPALLVVGGYDTANLPEIGYGNMRGGARRLISRTTMRLATRLIVNSHYICEEVMHNVGIAAERIMIVPHGIDTGIFCANGKKERLAITVGDVDRSTLKRKGIEDFVRAAQLLPDVRCVVIGRWIDDAIEGLRAAASPNVKFTGRVEYAELRDYFSRALVYVQPSRHEGFGMAVAEAMSSECVPVVTRAGALPEVVGDAGVYVDVLEPRAVAERLRYALDSAPELGRYARERIVREFPLERRRAGLFKLVDEVTNCGVATHYHYRSNPQ